MSPSSAIRCKLVALLLLISTTFVQAKKVIDILVTDERVIVTPPTNWGYWTFNKTAACPIWTAVPDGWHSINLNFDGVGITVHGYANPNVGPWRFQIDQEAPEVLAVAAHTTCKSIKDRQDLGNGVHQVTVTPLADSFVLSKFSVTQLDHYPLSGSGPRVIPCSLVFLFPLLVIVLSSDV